MFLVHLNPIVSTFIAYKSVKIELCTHHYLTFLPISVVYAYVNYLETKARGKPLYWFINWEDYTSVLVIVAIYVAFSLLWVVLAKCSQTKKLPKRTD